MCGRLDGYNYHFSTLPDVISHNSNRSDQNYKNIERVLLLLASLELIGCKIINRNFIEPTEMLQNRYENLIARYPFVQNCKNLAFPFIGLQATSFWLLRIKQNQNHIAPNKIKTVDQLREIYWGAKLREDLFPLLVMDTSRKKLEKTLIERYLLRRSKFYPTQNLR